MKQDSSNSAPCTLRGSSQARLPAGNFAAFCVKRLRFSPVTRLASIKVATTDPEQHVVLETIRNHSLFQRKPKLEQPGPPEASKQLVGLLSRPLQLLLQRFSLSLPSSIFRTVLATRCRIWRCVLAVCTAGRASAFTCAHCFVTLLDCACLEACVSNCWS